MSLTVIRYYREARFVGAWQKETYAATDSWPMGAGRVQMDPWDINDMTMAVRLLLDQPGGCQ